MAVPLRLGELGAPGANMKQLAETIFVAGHRGMVGSALLRQLRARGHHNIITASREELDLRDSGAVNNYFAHHRPGAVILAAAKVGGIRANQIAPADFLYDNLMIQSNVMHAAHRYGAHRLMFLGSSCIYPRDCPQPIREEYLLSGPLEPTNEAYALAKIAGLKLARYYHQQYGLSCICPMPCNLYGPNDSFDPTHSHVLSALVRKFVDATEARERSVTLWGTGSARREFLHVDDAATACLLLFDRWDSPDHVNVGSGIDITIHDLAQKIATCVGYTGTVVWDTSMPDGMRRKCLDISKLRGLGFHPRITLSQGIAEMVHLYRSLRNGHT